MEKLTSSLNIKGVFRDTEMQPQYIGLHLHSPGYGGTSVAEPKDSMPFCCYDYNQSPLKGISFSQVTTTTLSIQAHLNI